MIFYYIIYDFWKQLLYIPKSDMMIDNNPRIILCNQTKLIYLRCFSNDVKLNFIIALIIIINIININNNNNIIIIYYFIIVILLFFIFYYFIVIIIIIIMCIFIILTAYTVFRSLKATYSRPSVYRNIVCTVYTVKISCVFTFYYSMKICFRRASNL